jgi:hypothetical protein
LDRRLAALAAGLTDLEDPPGLYDSDVLTGSREGADLILFERCIGTARRIERMKQPEEFLMAFPEVARVLRYLDLPACQSAEQVFQLYRRHACQVTQALATAVQRESLGLVRGTLPSNCLLRLACGSTSQPVQRATNSPVESGSAGNSSLILDDNTLEARYGSKACFLGNGKEYQLLHRLLRRPGHFVTIDVLREDVWEGERVEKNTVQRTVSNLRRRLQDSGITEVVIDGSQANRYCVRPNN